MSIAENVARLQQRVTEAAARAGRPPESVKIVAVTKNVSIGEIEEAIGAGITDVGENRVQEMLPKMAAVTDSVTWHFIGHLQTNKTRLVVGRVALIHSVDSARLIQSIEREAARRGLVQDILIEVNVSGESSKFGVGAEELRELLRRIGEYPHVRARGLMTMAPLVSDPEETRPVFARLRELLEELRQSFTGLELLSMGMTQDFEVAIEEGSNMIRVGAAVFGTRTKGV